MASGWIRSWARAPRGVAAAARLVAGVYELELADACGARGLRLILSGDYDVEPFEVRATVCAGGRMVEVTFAGATRGAVPSGSRLTSDPVPLGASTSGPVRIRYTLRAPSGCASAFDAAPYDPVRLIRRCAHCADGVDAESIPHTIFGLCAIDLLDAELRGCVAFLGDSICEMGMYFQPARDFLRERGFAALNLGISGNRLLKGLEHLDFSLTEKPELAALAARYPGRRGPLPRGAQAYGAAGVERFEADILGAPGLARAVIALGVNDLYIPGTFCGAGEGLPSVDALMRGYATLARELDAHTAASAVWLGVTPFATAHAEAGARERIRRKINERLAEFAAERGEPMIAFDDALADGACHPLPHRYRDDLLHPSMRGGEAMFARMRGVLAD